MTGLTRSSYTLVTPEGVPLDFEVATLGDRLAAFVLDILVIVGAGVVILLLGFLSVFSQDGEIAASFAVVVWFLLWNFYFIISEMRGGGTTWGKRRLSLRVIARDGGSLTADMIIGRNLLRNVEITLPLIVLLHPQALFSQSPGPAVLLGSVWIFIFAILPLLGRLRLRCGDLVSGTMVILEPKVRLLPDLAASTAERGGKGETAMPGGQDDPYVFTTEQLGIYGIHELQVLEDLLRRYSEGRADRTLMRSVCSKILKKIDWPESASEVDTIPFLRSFYKLQRAHLEKKMLFGERKERKS